MGKVPAKRQTINKLIQSIRKTIEEGKLAAEMALEAEKTITYWKVGQQIYNYLLSNKINPENGGAVIEKIAQALEIGARTLYWALNFYEMYPKAPTSRPKLTWTHFRLLLSVKDESTRQELEKKVVSKHLTTRELLELVKKANENLLEYNSKKKLIVKRGAPYIYTIKTILKNGKETKYLDLGFRVYLDADYLGISKYQEGTILSVKYSKGKPVFNVLPETDKQLLYTYRSEVKSIIDGDTLWIVLDLGFNTVITQKIRLRGINAGGPETGIGKKAKEFIENKITPCKMFIVKTHSRDKYDRYLGDLFYNPDMTDIFEIAKYGTFLNMEMLDNRLVLGYKTKGKSYKKR